MMTDTKERTTFRWIPPTPEELQEAADAKALDTARAMLQTIKSADGGFLREALEHARRRDGAKSHVPIPGPFASVPAIEAFKLRLAELDQICSDAVEPLQVDHQTHIDTLRVDGHVDVERARTHAHKTEYRSKAKRWGPLDQDELATRRPVIALECSTLSPAAILKLFQMAESVGDSAGQLLYAEHGLVAARARTAGKAVGRGASLDDFVTVGEFERLVGGDAGKKLADTLHECDQVDSLLDAPVTTAEHKALMQTFGVSTAHWRQVHRPPPAQGADV